MRSIVLHSARLSWLANKRVPKLRPFFMCCALSLSLIPAPSMATPAKRTESVAPKNAPPGLKGFLDFNGYYDTRNFAELTLNILANLPYRFQYFSLTNLNGPPNSGGPLDLSSVYTEQNLRWAPSAKVPIDIVAQWVVRSGERNDLFRLGLRWRISKTPVIETAFSYVGLSYVVSVYGAQFDFIGIGRQGYRGQIEHVYRWPILPKVLDNRLYLEGFLDHTIWLDNDDDTPMSRIVTEHQLGLRLIAGLHVVGEYRFNEYLPLGAQHGAGFGIEYFIPFNFARR